MEQSRAPAPACFAQPSFEIGQVVILSIPGIAPMIGSYRGHDFSSITLGMPCGIQIIPTPQGPQVNMQPFGAPLMAERKERKFPLAPIFQIDLCGEMQIAEAYHNAFSPIKPAKANALDILAQKKKPQFT